MYTYIHIYTYYIYVSYILVSKYSYKYVLEFHTNLKLCPKILKVIIFINILVKQKNLYTI